MSNIGDDLSRGESTIGIETIQKILQALIRMNPKVEDNAIKKFVIQSLGIIKVNYSLSLSPISVTTGRQIASGSVWGYSKKIYKRVRGYPLVHTTVGAGFTFPTIGSIYGCQCVGEATTYIRIDHHTWLDVGTGALVLVGRIKFTGTANKTLTCKGNSVSGARIQLDITNSGDSLTITITDGTNTATLQSTALATLNDGNWHSFVINIPAAGSLEIFIDKVSKGTVSRGSVGSLNISRAWYIFGRDNAGTIDQIYSEKSALIFAAKKTWTQAMIDDFHDKGIIAIADSTTSTNIELFFIPMEGRANSRSNAFCGMCRAGV